jgi:hypothetical protein
MIGKRSLTIQMRFNEFITEITRLSPGQFPGLDLSRKTIDLDLNKLKPLPGGSGLRYYTMASGYVKDIRILTTDNKLAGQLTLSKSNFPMDNAYESNSITVDKKYRGQGIGKSLYGIALSIMKYTLVSGNEQTPGGRRNWSSIANIPGVEVNGYVKFNQFDLGIGLDSAQDIYKSSAPWYRNAKIKEIEYYKKNYAKTIDTVMGKMGGQYIGQSNNGYYFSFPVVANEAELKSAIDVELTRLYRDRSDTWNIGSDKPIRPLTGLYAYWAG